MVYYHTSGNVKMIRNIIDDYSNTAETSPYEYMKTYIEKCPESTEDSKLTWIAETFLSIHKHEELLRDIASYLNEELTEEEQQYFMIIFHAIIFQIEPKDMQYFYKCVFNLSKSLLNTFTKFLSNNEVLTYISQVAQAYYDHNYITNKIIGPLFEWQPYISEMEHSYAEYVSKTESRKHKQPTVPVAPNLSIRKPKEVPNAISQQVLLTDTKSTGHITQNKKKRMLTKSTIDQRLQEIHNKHQRRASYLLKNVKSKDSSNSHNSHNYQAPKSAKTCQRISINKGDNIVNIVKPRPSNFEKRVPQVKETATTVKRLNKRIQMEEQEEISWLHNIICYRNTSKFEELAEQDKKDKERERLMDIEKKHLTGLISYEEAVLAKKKVVDENKKKYEAFLKEKQSWNEKLESWKKSQMEKNKKSIEKQSFSELSIMEAKNVLALKKKEAADALKKETESLLSAAMQMKVDELEKKVAMIKEIKILQVISRKSRVPKVIDLTDTSNLGLLCEMSIAELQERLSAMKMELKEEMENKRKCVSEQNEIAKKLLEEEKNNIRAYVEERTQMRERDKFIKESMNLNCTVDKSIRDLKKMLDEKRALRIKLNNPLPPC